MQNTKFGYGKFKTELTVSGVALSVGRIKKRRKFLPWQEVAECGFYLEKTSESVLNFINVGIEENAPTVAGSGVYRLWVYFSKEPIEGKKKNAFARAYRAEANIFCPVLITDTFLTDALKAVKEKQQQITPLIQKFYVGKVRFIEGK